MKKKIKIIIISLISLLCLGALGFSYVCFYCYWNGPMPIGNAYGTYEEFVEDIDRQLKVSKIQDRPFVCKIESHYLQETMYYMHGIDCCDSHGRPFCRLRDEKRHYLYMRTYTSVSNFVYSEDEPNIKLKIEYFQADSTNDVVVTRKSDSYIGSEHIYEFNNSKTLLSLTYIDVPKYKDLTKLETAIEEVNQQILQLISESTYPN